MIMAFDSIDIELGLIVSQTFVKYKLFYGITFGVPEVLEFIFNLVDWDLAQLRVGTNGEGHSEVKLKADGQDLESCS